MSIEKRVVPFSRSFRSLIKTTRPWQNIKDLKNLRALRVCAGYSHSGPTDLKRTRDVFFVARTVARDRPSPYGEVPFFTVARGPVPRDRWSTWTLARDRPSPYDERGLSAAAPGGLSYTDL